MVGLIAVCPKTGINATNDKTLANNKRNWYKTCSFNNDKLQRDSKRLIYIKNPANRSPGFTVSITDKFLKNKDFLDSVKEQFGLHESTSLFINKGKDFTRGSFTISNKLYSEVGADKYEKIINFCIDKLTN